MTSHPSWVELDAFYLGDAALSDHVRGCNECSAYLEQLREPLAPAPWLARAAPRRWPLLAVAALAASLAVFLARPSSAVREKGPPAVAVTARHGNRVAAWDGKTTFAPGDAIRLEVYPAELPVVAVATLRDGALTRLYDGELKPSRATLLPLSFTFDAQPGPEIVWVVSSSKTLNDAGLRDAIDHQQRSATAWTTRLEFPKENAR
jgi:hypothetical protein